MYAQRFRERLKVFHALKKMLIWHCLHYKAIKKSTNRGNHVSKQHSAAFILCCFSLDFLTLIHFVNHSSFFKLDTEHWGISLILVAFDIVTVLWSKSYISGISLLLTYKKIKFAKICYHINLRLFVCLLNLGFTPN